METSPQDNLLPKLVSPPTPGLMAVVSLLISGLGQIICGQVGKGLVLLVLTIVVAIGSAGMFAPVMWIIAAVDAYKVAKCRGTRPLGRWEWFPS